MAPFFEVVEVVVQVSAGLWGTATARPIKAVKRMYLMLSYWTASD